MGFSSTGLRSAIETFGIDRIVFGADFGPVPFGIQEHIELVNNVLPRTENREKVFWKTSDSLFKLGLSVS